MPDLIVYYQPQPVIRHTEIEDNDFESLVEWVTDDEVFGRLQEMVLADQSSAQLMVDPRAGAALDPIGAAIVVHSEVVWTTGTCPLRVGDVLTD